MSVVNLDPLISIITPNYNGQKFIKKTEQKIEQIKQQFPEIEFHKKRKHNAASKDNTVCKI